MEFRGVFVLVVVGVAISCVQGFPSPRDSTVVKSEEVIRADDSSLIPTAKDNIDQAKTTTVKSELTGNRDSTVVKTEEVIRSDDSSLIPTTKDNIDQAKTTTVKSEPTGTRDSTVVKSEEVIRSDDSSLIPAAKDHTDQGKPTSVKSEPTETIHIPTTEKIEIITPKHVSCEHEEATDDLVCQEHCLPKGYSYGLCVSYKCSCI